MKSAELDQSTTSPVTRSTGTTMKALVYHGPGKRAWEGQARPGDPDAGRRHRADHHLTDLR